MLPAHFHEAAGDLLTIVEKFWDCPKFWQCSLNSCYFRVVFRIFRSLLLYHLNSNLIVQLDNSSRTRGHSKKLIKPRVTSTIKQHTLGYRVIQDWNSLPEEVVTAETVNVFKTRLEKFWENKDFKFDPSGHYGVLN